MANTRIKELLAATPSIPHFSTTAKLANRAIIPTPREYFVVRSILPIPLSKDIPTGLKEISLAINDNKNNAD
ncbi:MAG: hypothetical protein ABH950_06150, partial [Candidatus Altiarchaeota archaeon]